MPSEKYYHLIYEDVDNLDTYELSVALKDEIRYVNYMSFDKNKVIKALKSNQPKNVSHPNQAR